MIADAVLPGNAAAMVVMPDGWRYQADFVPEMEENRLLEVIATLPFEAARYQGWTARRRIVSYGGRYDFSRNVLEPAAPHAVGWLQKLSQPGVARTPAVQQITANTTHDRKKGQTLTQRSALGRATCAVPPAAACGNPCAE